MVFVSRHLRYDLPEQVAKFLLDKDAYPSEPKYPKPIIVIGECAAYRVMGDWFQGLTVRSEVE